MFPRGGASALAVVDLTALVASGISTIGTVRKHNLLSIANDPPDLTPALKLCTGPRMPDLPPPPPLPDDAALFLDFDGTLVELAETPAAIRVPAALGPTLGRLRQRLGGRLAIVSGRSLADLERHLPAAGIAFAGSHGLE